MNWAQRAVPPTRATIIYAGEPVWAGIIGRIAGDRLPAIAIGGAAFIVTGSLVSELTPRSRRHRDTASTPNNTMVRVHPAEPHLEPERRALT